MPDDSWDDTPRMLQELCDGHPGYSIEVYALDLLNGVRLWLCKSCWVNRWIATGRPPQPKVAVCPECGHRDPVTPADPFANVVRLGQHRWRVHGLTTTQQSAADATTRAATLAQPRKDHEQWRRQPK